MFDRVFNGFRGSKDKDDTLGNEGSGPQGFTRDIDLHDDGADVDEDELIDDDQKSEEPDDAESLDERIDE
jgi:hypothetical protein